MKNKVALFLLLVMLESCFLCACKDIDSTKSEISAESSNVTVNESDYGVMKIISNDDGTQTLDFSPSEDTKSYAAHNQPFANIFKSIPINLTYNPTRAISYRSEISYEKRDGGSFIYSNNPEMLQKEDLGAAILRNEGLTGECIFTLEHSNRTESPMYLGYQLLNTSDSEITVTVTNIGYQVEGEWLGQRSWSDYFNYRFELPFDYFLDNGEVNPVYFGCDYIDYTPRVYEPQTFVIPSGEYFYVLGGTSDDAYNNINVGGTADMRVELGKCVNGVVKFTIEGEAQGTFYCYTDASQVQSLPVEQGYIVERGGMEFGAQYKGIDYKQGLIEANLTFVVNDNDRNGNLPIQYNKKIDTNYTSKTEPYAALDTVMTTVKDTKWVTSLNPNYSSAIGTDMSVFNCIDTDGNAICIDTEHLDGRGDLANIGNWMIQYTDNFTFINTGDKPRIFKIYKQAAAAGASFAMVRDYDGNIIDAKMRANPYYFESLDSVFYGIDKSLLVEKNGLYWMKVEGDRPYCDVMPERALCYELTVQPKSVERISVDYLILGNSNGGITHWVTVDDVQSE